MISEQGDLIGQVLLDIGYISPDQLAEARAQQDDFPEKLLGELLVELGYLSVLKLKKGLALQEMERAFKERENLPQKSKR